MKNATIFRKPLDLYHFENDDEIILRKGYLHKNELIIDKRESSKGFIDALKSFLANNKIELLPDNSIYDDFTQLMRFDLIELESKVDKIVIYVNRNYIKRASCIFGDNYKIEAIDTLLSREDIDKLNEEKDLISMNYIADKSLDYLRPFDYVYFVEHFKNFTTIRAFNRLMKRINKENTIGIVDDNNIYLTGIKHGYTGCYECLEKHIMTKFPGHIEDYKTGKDIKESMDYELNLIFSLIQTDIKSYLNYGGSTLQGNVMHFYLPNYEYEFDKNRRTSSCSTCATLNQIIFEEQNIRAINVIKELI